MNENTGKVTADHLRRDAYLYVRQSTLYQVANNTESTRRQYDLRGRAVALGWPAERVVVIDVDQGQSGSSASRPGRLPAPGRRRVPRQGRHRARPGMLPAGPQQRRLAPAAADCARSTPR